MRVLEVYWVGRAVCAKFMNMILETLVDLNNWS